MEELGENAYFYKWIGGQWHYGRKIYFPDGSILDWQLRDTYEYPVDGWTWYDERPEDLN